MTKFLISRFIKDYENVTNLKVREHYGLFAGIVGVCTNIVLFTIKLISGILFNSISLIADAVNNLTDTASSFVTMFGFKISAKPADEKHPYGHARMEYVAGLIVSVMVLFLGFQLLKSSFEKIIHPEELNVNNISIAIVIVSILLKIWQSRFYYKLGNTIDSITLKATGQDSRNDVLATGSILVSFGIKSFFGLNIDGFIGLGIAIFIIISGINLIVETIDPLLGTAPPQDLVDAINIKMNSYEDILGHHDLSVHSYGVGKTFASIHCEVSRDFDFVSSHTLIDIIEKDFKEDLNIRLVIHVDPVSESGEVVYDENMEVK